MESKIKEFIKLPNSLVWDIRGKREKTYSYEFTEKVCYIWSIFDCLLNRIGYISFSLEQLINTIGIKANNHAGRNVDQFRNVLIGLEEKKFITDASCDFNLVKHKELITCKYSIPMLIDEEGKDTQFFIVYRGDYLRLLNCETDFNKITLIYVYYYLLSRMKNGKGDTIRYCFPSYDDIEKELNISQTTFNKYINELQKLELIAYGNIGVITKNGKTRQASNVYCREASHLLGALDISKNYWNAEGYKVVGKTASKTQASIRGLKGQIKKQINEGKDTTKLEKKLANLEKKVTNKVGKSMNDIKREIKLLNDNMIESVNKNNSEIEDVFDVWEQYFIDLDKDMYDIDDCAEVLEYIKELHKKQLQMSDLY